MSPRARASRLALLLALAGGILVGGDAGAAVSFVEPRALPLPVDGSAYAGVYGVASGDFDGDGRLDVAATGAGLVPVVDPVAEHDFVAVLLGNGDGSFQAPAIVDLGARDTAQPGGVAATDLDGDGHLDLVVVAQQPRALLVLLGRGDGTFVAPAAYATGADAVTDLRLADLDRDGHLDAVLVSMNLDLSTRQLAILEGDGAGHFGTPVVRTVGRLPQGLAVADLDGRNGPDIVVACRAGAQDGGSVEVLLNDGSGGFPFASTPFLPRTSPFGLWVADFDGDGDLDVLVPGWEGALGNTCGTGCLALLRGDGLGGLASPTEADVWKAEGSVLVAMGDTARLDLNGDGRPDALFGHIGVNEVTTFLSQPGGGYGTAGWVASPGSGLPGGVTSRVDGNHVLGIVAGDFDGDGAPDLVAASQGDSRAGGLSFVRGVAGAPGTFEAPRVLSAPRGGYYAISPRSLALRDLTGDGRLDLLFHSGPLDTFPGLGSGQLGAAIDALPVPGSEFYNSLRVGDLDGDGELDVVFLGVDGVQGGNPPRHLVFLGNGDGTFGSGQQLFPQTPGAAGRNAALADLDGDGDLDLVVLTDEIGFTHVLTKVETWRNGGGSPLAWTAGGVSVIQSQGTLASTGLAAADFDGDGRADVVAHRLGPTDDLLFLKGNGDGTFQAPVPVSSGLGQPADTVLAGDLDGDGHLDLVVLGTWGGAHVQLGRGDGTFLPRAAHDIGEGSSDGRLVDLDGDGHLDVVTAAANGLAVLPGRGDGTFGPRRPFATGVTASAALAAGDLDGDGKPELVIGHGSPANRHFFTVLRNASGELADLAVAGGRTPTTLHAGEIATVSFSIRNLGPDPASATTLRSPLRHRMELLSSSATAGTCAPAGGAVSCALGSLAAGSGVTVTLRLRPSSAGLHWVTASAASGTPEANGADNAASVAAAAVEAQADLRVALACPADPVTVGQPLAYTATVANDGPSQATAATVVIGLPQRSSWSSTAASQGGCNVPSGPAVVCDLGALESGASATVTVVVAPSAAGTLVAQAQIGSAVADPHAADDVASASATAVEPAPAEGKKGGCGCGAPEPGGLLGVALLLAALRRRTDAPGSGPAAGRSGQRGRRASSPPSASARSIGTP